MDPPNRHRVQNVWSALDSARSVEEARIRDPTDREKTGVVVWRRRRQGIQGLVVLAGQVGTACGWDRRARADKVEIRTHRAQWSAARLLLSSHKRRSLAHIMCCCSAVQTARVAILPTRLCA